MAHGVTEDITVGLTLPYITREGIREVADEEHEEGEEEHTEEASVEHQGDAQGLGDLALYGQYRFYHDESAHSASALLLGIKAPSGETDEVSADGHRFELELQPGSGSWDPFIGLALNRKWNGMGVDANVLFTYTTEGKQNTTLGSSLAYNIALSHRLGVNEDHGHSNESDQDHAHRFWDVVLEINGEWRDKDDVDSVENPNSGGHLLFLSPGARLSSETGWYGALLLGLPVVKDLNGHQVEPKYRIIASLGKAF